MSVHEIYDTVSADLMVIQHRRMASYDTELKSSPAIQMNDETTAGYMSPSSPRLGDWDRIEFAIKPFPRFNVR